jgi:hypothetical protein
MYETPALTPVGNAETVIRGVDSIGWDADSLLMDSALEFRDELESLDPSK